MKGFRFISAMLAMVLVFGLVLSGCATTSSINYAVDTQPAGNYKQVVLSVNSGFTGGGSVLQRFYERYPSSQYEVVAIEKVTKNWMLLAPVGGGVLLGFGIGAAVGASGTGIFGFPSILGGIGILGGYIWHQISGNTYVVTYTERESVAPLTTQGPQG